MVEVAIMIEGQNGLNWPRWQRIVRAVEDLGFAGLYRSDHFTNAQAPDIDSLELWVSLTWLAANTRRIEFGPLVTPVSFRDPVFTARMALQVGDLSNGRLRLGVGAGWQEREHALYGYHLLDVPRRFARFTEGLEVITHLLRSDEPLTFEGTYYQLHGARLLPRPQRPGGPPVVIGGNGEKLTFPLIARYADEWNGVFLPAPTYARLNQALDGILHAGGRDPSTLRRTLMTNVIFGRTDVELRQKLDGRDPATLRDRGLIVAAGQQIQEALLALETSGARRVMLQWLDLDDLDGLEALARAAGVS